jgi:hypothetical protein
MLLLTLHLTWTSGSCQRVRFSPGLSCLLCLLSVLTNCSIDEEDEDVVSIQTEQIQQLPRPIPLNYRVISGDLLLLIFISAEHLCRHHIHVSSNWRFQLHIHHSIIRSYFSPRISTDLTHCIFYVTMLQLSFAISCLLCMGLSYNAVYNPYSHLKSIFSHHMMVDLEVKLENRKSIAQSPLVTVALQRYTFAGTEVKFKDKDSCGVDHFRICPHSCFSSNALVICTLFIDFPLIFHFPHLRGSGSLLRTNGQLVDPVNHPDVSLKR